MAAVMTDYYYYLKHLELLYTAMDVSCRLDTVDAALISSPAKGHHSV